VPTDSDVAYLDSSALFKLVVQEEESEVLRLALRAWPRRMSSRVSVVELLRGVRRRDLLAEPLARRVLTHVSLLRIGDGVLTTAARLDPPTVRSLDAIHVASALRLGDSLTAFVSYDGRQLEAAASVGVPVTSPGRT
jgi:predicted nucleic acid-binding protein